VGETEYISRLEVEKHNHLSSIEDNRVVDVVQKHKIATALDTNIAPRKMVANIRSELAALGGIMPASQKSLASNVQKKRASLGGLPKPPKIFSDILDTFPDRLKVTNTGEPFLHYMGTTEGDQVYIIFGRMST